MKNYPRAESSVNSFLHCCTNNNPAMESRATELYQAYIKHCWNIGSRPLSQTHIGGYLGTLYQKRHRITGTYYVGLVYMRDCNTGNNPEELMGMSGLTGLHDFSKNPS